MCLRIGNGSFFPFTTVSARRHAYDLGLRRASRNRNRLEVYVIETALSTAGWAVRGRGIRIASIGTRVCAVRVVHSGIADETSWLDEHRLVHRRFRRAAPRRQINLDFKVPL